MTAKQKIEKIFKLSEAGKEHTRLCFSEEVMVKLADEVGVKIYTVYSSQHQKYKRLKFYENGVEVLLEYHVPRKSGVYGTAYMYSIKVGKEQVYYAPLEKDVHETEYLN